MPVLISPYSAYGKALAEWEQHRTAVVDPEGRPGNEYQYRPYPKMLYKAQRHPRTGKLEANLGQPQDFEHQTMDSLVRAQNEVNQFNKTCQRIVTSEDEERAAKNDGWCNGPDLAIAAAHERDRQIGDAAAERHYSDQRLTEHAKAEAALVDREFDGHQAEVTADKVKQAKDDVRKARG